MLNITWIFIKKKYNVGTGRVLFSTVPLMKQFTKEVESSHQSSPTPSVCSCTRGVLGETLMTMGTYDCFVQVIAGINAYMIYPCLTLPSLSKWQIWYLYRKISNLKLIFNFNKHELEYDRSLRLWLNVHYYNSRQNFEAYYFKV